MVEKLEVKEDAVPEAAGPGLVMMKSVTGDHTSISIGGKETPVRKGLIRVLVADIEAMISHGFEVVKKEL